MLKVSTKKNFQKFQMYVFLLTNSEYHINFANIRGPWKGSLEGSRDQNLRGWGGAPLPCKVGLIEIVKIYKNKCKTGRTPHLRIVIHSTIFFVFLIYFLDTEEYEDS